jgi:lipopolysaccharide transport system ATP-binding protein
MSSAIITVESLGKKYQINHQAGRQRYVALRDVITEKFKGMFRNGKSAAANGASVEDFWAVKDVSFEVQQGEVVGVIGRNGAGKSTLLKLLSRITEPTQGRIRLRGRVASLLEVGTGFHPELTGRENIFLNGAILGMSRVEIQRKFDEIVAFSEVERFLDTPVKRYSSGMYVRLAFAVAAHLEPEILVVDEVLAVGDAAFQKKCLGKMQDVSKGGRTVLFVSHNMEMITRLTSRCIYLVRGELQTEGETAQVIKAYSEQVRQAAREVDLTRMGRRYEGSGTAKLIKLITEQNESEAAWCYQYGMPIKFSLELLVLKPIDEPEIGYAIFALSGTELISSTTHQESPISRILPGRYLVQIEIPNPLLNPGAYILGLGIATPGKSVDHVGEAVQIEIMPTEESIKKGLYKICASVTPRTTFHLQKI